MPIPEEPRAMGARPAWNGYVLVDDVDVYAERVKAAGYSTSLKQQVTRNARQRRQRRQGRQAMSAGMNLHAGDGPSAFAFYSGLFGWTKAEAMDMGPMSGYQIFATGGAPCGGMMTKMPQTPAPFWLYYFNVDAVEAAMARVKDAGGPIILPGGSWIAHGLDPQGAIFAMVGPKG
jgi:predicted enzyme related to lactoylglutathione lyase